GARSRDRAWRPRGLRRGARPHHAGDRQDHHRRDAPAARSGIAAHRPGPRLRGGRGPLARRPRGTAPLRRDAMAMKDLAQQMNTLCDAVLFQTSWYLKDLTTGERVDRLGDTPVPSASTRKISIMMAALKAVHDGK